MWHQIGTLFTLLLIKYGYVYGYIEKNNGNKYLTLIPADERKETLKKYEEVRDKIRDFIRSTSNNLNDYILSLLVNS